MDELPVEVGAVHITSAVLAVTEAFSPLGAPGTSGTRRGVVVVAGCEAPTLLVATTLKV